MYRVTSVWTKSAVLMMVGAGLLAGCGNTTPSLTITEPKDGITITGSRVRVVVKVNNYKLVDAGTPVKDSEGHLHFYIDQPANVVPVGQPIPSNPSYIHAGKAPYESRELTLNPGQHTITVVMGNSQHQVVAVPAATAVTITVK